MSLPHWVACRRTLTEHKAAYALARSTKAYRAKCRALHASERRTHLRAAILWLRAALDRPGELPSADIPALEETLDLYRLEWVQGGGLPIGRRRPRGGVTA